MANQVRALLAGFDYQHLVAWQYMLELLMPGRALRSVTIEDPEAASVDDVTLEYEPGTDRPDRFLQIKYHVDQRGQYSTSALLEAKGTAKSLLSKFYISWQTLRDRSDSPLELHLLSNWTWDSSDYVGRCIRGNNGSLGADFFTASHRTKVGRARERWREHLAIGPDDFQSFAGSLRFRLGFSCTDELVERVAERMESLGLKHDRAALVTSVGVVRELVKAADGPQTKEKLESCLEQYALRLPPTADKAVTVYLSTVKQQRFDLAPDYLLDWRRYFEGSERKRGHRPLDPTMWNQRMLPELHALEEEINTGTTARLIRARGLARLSAWFAFGHAFSDVARYTIEVDQQGRKWRTDTSPSDLQVVESGRYACENGDPAAVAIGVSVTGSLEDDVRRYVGQARTSREVLFLRPDRELGRDCFGSAADVAAFARGAKEHMRSFVERHGATRLLLFYFGPLSGACFLGHQLNAVARQVQIMEDQQPGYENAFLLA